MKKLMTMIATVAMAFGLYADGLKNTVGFEDGAYTAGSKIDVTKGDDGETTQAPVWSATDPTETGTVTEYGTDTKYDYGTQPVIVTDGPGNQFLALETAGLFRNITAGGTASGLANGDVFFDTLVKLSATDGLSVPELSNDAKIAIWAGTDEDNNPGVTNLYVTAAAGATGEAKPEAANFTISVGDEFDFNAWHRITVRSLVANTDDAKVAGFVVFVDGVQVACSDEDYPEKLGEGLTLTTEANKFAEQKQLFIGLVYGTDATMLTALGFSGTGAADDVAITDAANAPQFAKGEKVFTLTWDKDAFVSITAGGVDQKVEDGKADITLDGLTTELAVSGVVNTGYKLIGLTAKEGCTADNENGKFTGIVGAAAGSIDAKKLYFTVNGEQYATFADAMTAAASAPDKKIALMDNYVASSATEGEDFDGFTIASDLIIDLAGKSFTTAYAENYFFTLKNSATLTLTNSVADVATVGAPTATEYELFRISGGKLVVAANSDIDFNGGLVTGGTDTDVALFAGNYDNVNNGKDDLELHIDTEKYEVVDTVKDGYWTVQEKQAKNFIIEIVDGDRYESIADALAAAENNDTLKLLKDVATDAEIAIGKSITFDFGGYTLTAAANDDADAIWIKAGATVTLTNGKLVDNNDKAIYDSGDLTIAKDFEVVANLNTGILAIVGKNSETRAKLTVYGKVSAMGTANGTWNAVTGHGTDTTVGADIVIGEGADIKSAGNGVYFPCAGTLTINGGKIDGAECGIYAKSGTVTVNGGEISSSAVAVLDPAVNPSGSTAAGYAMVVETGSQNQDYANHLSFTITDGKFTSVGPAVYNFVQTGADSIAAGIKGGLFKAQPADALLVQTTTPGYEVKWVDAEDGYVKPEDVAITYNITYTFTGVEEADKGKIVNPNASTTTYTIESETITFEDASCDGYEFKGFAPAAITQGSTGDQKIVGTFEKKQQGWPEDPQTVKGQSAGVALGITGKLAGADACVLSTWAKDFSVTFNVDVDQYENAFLLNCDPAEVEDAEKAFKFTAITPGTTPTTTTQYNGRDYNGKVQITAYEDVGFTKPVDNPTGAEAELFYKAELILVPVNE